MFHSLTCSGIEKTKYLCNNLEDQVQILHTDMVAQERQTLAPGLSNPLAFFLTCPIYPSPLRPANSHVLTTPLT